jgi:hypothetical protein
MMSFKFFHGYVAYKVAENIEGESAFERLMNMLHEMDAMVEPNRGNYEIPDDISDWDVTISDGLGEE